MPDHYQPAEFISLFIIYYLKQCSWDPDWCYSCDLDLWISILLMGSVECVARKLILVICFSSAFCGIKLYIEPMHIEISAPGQANLSLEEQSSSDNSCITIYLNNFMISASALDCSWTTVRYEIRWFYTMFVEEYYWHSSCHDMVW